MFIILEATEGAGKTSLKEYLVEASQHSSFEWVFTREPGGTPMGEKLRAILLDKDNTLTDSEEILLLLTGRKRHLEEVIKPALEAGKVVLCERWLPTTLAYQAYGRGNYNDASAGTFYANMDLIMSVSKSLGLLKTPVDLGILLDVCPTIGHARISGRGEPDRIEMEGFDFFHRVRDGFLNIFKGNHRSIMKKAVIVDASEPIEVVQNAVKAILIEHGVL